jgi:tripartite-type tricarboxylate transporter receptor subunit TctC
MLVRFSSRALAILLIALALATVWFMPSDAGAADDTKYPDRPVRVVAGFSAGSAVDLSARIIAEKLAESLKQPFVMENRVGAGGAVAAQAVAKATPDGYTLLSVSAAHVILPAISATPIYQAQDFTGISTTISVPSVLAVNSKLGAKSVRDLAAMARAKPGELMFSSGGVGSATHFAAELFKSIAEIDVRHVPYRGIPEALTEVVAGRIHFTFSPLSSVLPLVQTGEIVPLAVTPAVRAAALPDVPTMAEAGMSGYAWVSWFAMLAPANTPLPIVQLLNREIVRIVQLPDVNKKWETLGAEAMPMTHDAFEKYLTQQSQLVAQLVKAADIQAK